MKLAFITVLTLSLLQPIKGMHREHPFIDTLYSLSKSENKSPNKTQIKLPIYQVNSCLLSSLNGLVEKDKQCNNKVGYYFSTTSIDGKSLISISPVNLDRVHPGSFFGYFIYRNRIFLCLGSKSEYLSALKTIDTIELNSYSSNEFTYDDFYLGGDTDGVLQQVACSNITQYILLKSCNTVRSGSK